MNEIRAQKRSAGPVVDAFDGTDDGARALRYGVDQARRFGRRLRLVHVPHQAVPMTPMLPLLAAETLREVAHRVLADAEKKVDELAHGTVQVEAILAPGPRVPAILTHSADASLVVVGQRSSAARRWLTGSTTTGVAAGATCPVVCVPAGWDPALEHRRVLAGVDGSDASVHVIEAALAAADERGAALSLLHAWRPVGEYDAAIVQRVLVDEWRSQADRHLAELTAVAGKAHPDVMVTRKLEYCSPAVALVQASANADLLVIGRRGAGAPFGLSLGSLARTMIRSAHCPVEVVPTPALDKGERHAQSMVGAAN
jgi:nucleotide-binding universal stress UspA family protein